MPERDQFHSVGTPGRPGRVIPRWAAELLARLTQRAPAIVTPGVLGDLLAEVGSDVSVDAALKRLLRLGWLRSVAVRGAFAFVGPGVDELADPYIDLRAWQAREPSATFCLAGDNAAWHLGYLDRMPERTTVWVPPRAVLPKGLRHRVSCVRTRFPAHIDARGLGPTPALLRKRRLDLLTWSASLPAFGPEALVVQVSSRPASFASWVDLAGKLEEVARDVDIERLRDLLAASSDAARQRAAYLLRLGKRDDATSLLPATPQPVEFGSGGAATWDGATRVNDHLVARLMDANAKA